MRAISVPSKLVEQTLDELQGAGARGHERVVLWLGSRKADQVAVEEVFVPVQRTASDYFHIPREGMAQLMKCLREKNFLIAAQVHSHPEEAFHSKADDDWAIVRHVGALSLVLPHFALETTEESFVTDASLFELAGDNKWIEVPKAEIFQRYVVTHE